MQCCPFCLKAKGLKAKYISWLLFSSSFLLAVKKSTLTVLALRFVASPKTCVSLATSLSTVSGGTYRRWESNIVQMPNTVKQTPAYANWEFITFRFLYDWIGLVRSRKRQKHGIDQMQILANIHIFSLQSLYKYRL